MPLNVIYSECSLQIWLDIAQNLNKDYNWQPCYWTGSKNFEKNVKKRFPNVVFHTNIDAVRGIPADDCKKLSIPALDQALLNKLAFCELISLRMMNRMDRQNTFSFEERERLFDMYVRYWSGVLDFFKPDVIVSPVSPHLIYDYVLYSLCKLRKIKTIMFVQTSIDGWIYPVEHFEVGSKSINSAYEKIKNSAKKNKYKGFNLSDDAVTHLEKLSGDYNKALPFYMKKQFEQKKLGTYTFKKIVKNPNDISNIMQKAKHLFTRGHYIKQRHKKIEESEMKGLEYMLGKLEGINKKNRLRSYYKKLEQEVDFERPYIYFPLHYQPENTTSPVGESYANQFLIIDLLSKCMPKDWILYVKEHSSQWHMLMHGECSRTTDFYNDVALMPNAKLIPLSASNFDLIDNSKAVVTVTGTTGWEAVVRGVPALIFGHAWYKNCEGVFYTPTEEKCREVLSNIQSGYKVDKKLVRLFVNILEQNCIKAYVDLAYKNVANISYEENITALAQTIKNFYKQ